MAILREVIKFHSRGRGVNMNLDDKIKILDLTGHEIDLLVAFLGSLSHPETD